MSKTVFITGCSSGLGHALAEAAAHRGYSVAATARQVEDLIELQELFPAQISALRLDLTDPESIYAAVRSAHEAFGWIDILINNAGSGLLGALEDVSEEQIRENLEVNLLGPLHVLRAVLPIFREQRSGTIVNISALAAFANHPGFTVYGGAKAAMETVCDGLAAELAPFHIKVLNVEPGPLRTDFIRRSLDRSASSSDGYASTVGKFDALLRAVDGKQTGDPVNAAESIFQAIESPNPPSKLMLGKYAYKVARQKIATLTRDLDEWEPVGVSADFAIPQRPSLAL